MKKRNAGRTEQARQSNDVTITFTRANASAQTEGAHCRDCGWAFLGMGVISGASPTSQDFSSAHRQHGSGCLQGSAIRRAEAGGISLSAYRGVVIFAGLARFTGTGVGVGLRSVLIVRLCGQVADDGFR
ncbi:MAG: hypothetical protein OXU51_11900 [Candidatus Poribacteria bacterium]|nr:hypothetical protein [Candidatus Poribacteria bacterium]